jgi:hypothetical protein
MSGDCTRNGVDDAGAPATEYRRALSRALFFVFLSRDSRYLIAMPKTSSRTPSRRAFRLGRSITGLGLFATKPLKKGDFIAKYWGPRISNSVADERDNRYLFELNKRWTIDGSSRRNIARYINHSCRPNAESDIIKGEIIISAIKTINPGDEITYNYGKEHFDGFIKPKGCLCVKCRELRAEGNGKAKKNGAAKRNGAGKHNGSGRKNGRS